ncbi:hypothetical protein RBWH47_05281 [Rhodopirellula baltica WH47]|uniref:Uncharacterized protein n=1 Tax=Rhodopirellula baltica WH47 TaxID=991778 RepID=F2AZP5_RHOBT|nr:hypothetical protein RBWH47_05281 [Rhodopirellula baltica WH47]
MSSLLQFERRLGRVGNNPAPPIPNVQRCWLLNLKWMMNDSTETPAINEELRRTNWH